MNVTPACTAHERVILSDKRYSISTLCDAERNRRMCTSLRYVSDLLSIPACVNQIEFL